MHGLPNESPMCSFTLPDIYHCFWKIWIRFQYKTGSHQFLINLNARYFHNYCLKSSRGWNLLFGASLCSYSTTSGFQHENMTVSLLPCVQPFVSWGAPVFIPPRSQSVQSVHGVRGWGDPMLMRPLRRLLKLIKSHLFKVSTKKDAPFRGIFLFSYNAWQNLTE